MVASLFLLGHHSTAQEKNSTQKIRVKPSTLSAQIGNGVHWEKSFSDALAKSKETGKPVFWYVPTLRGSFMDRKVEIDRYMLAGPFSWPNLVNGINNSFVPVRALPTRKEQEQFELLPYKFVEPGFLIINSDESVTARVDRITTFSPQWFRKLLSEHGVNVPLPKTRDEMQKWWSDFRNGNYDVEIPEPTGQAADAVEHWLLAGMFQFRKGNHEAAKSLWLKGAKSNPDHPLAWKAAAEAQGIGPFSRGFEIHRNVKAAALDAGTKSIGSASPSGVYDAAELWNRSVDFLLAMQRQDGAWVDSDYDFGGTDSLPNVHVAVTSLCGMALMNAKPNVTGRDEEIDSAVARALKFISNPKNINPVDRDEILWAHAYRVRFLARAVKSNQATAATLQTAVSDLSNVQSKRGHWYHEYNNSWVTATALCALHEAKTAGASVDMVVIEKGCKALANDRFGNGSYGYYPRRGEGAAPAGNEESVAAAAGRMPPCDLGLWYWKRLGDMELVNALNQSFKHHDKLAIALKYDNHTSTYAYGGFFFWYDMRARSEAISCVDDADLRADFFAKQKKLILELPEFDGCFVDSHELGRCYGTAMALLCLAREQAEN